MLTQNALYAFLSLAETGSFQQAAQSMKVSNASFSRYINQAEEQVGFQLFLRGRNNSSLTRQGRELLPLAIRLRQDMERFSGDVAALQETGPGSLLIGCGPLTTRTLIVPAIRAVRKAFPDLRYKILVSAYGRPLDLLQHGEFDAFVGDLTYTPKANGVDIMVVKKRPIVFVASPQHDIHDRGPCTLHDVFSYPFASPHLHKHWRSELTAALGGDAAAGEKVRALPQVECDDYSMLTGLLSEPEFILGGVRETFQEYLDLGLATEIRVTPQIQWNICAARKTDNTSEVLDLFWNALERMNRS